MERSGLIKKYINNYDFEKMLNDFYQVFIKKTPVVNYLNRHSEEDFRLFVNEFWHTPDIAVTKLKKKYGIPSTIVFSDILNAYPHEKYIEMLKCCWEAEDSAAIIKERYSSINRIVYASPLPIVFFNPDLVCPSCLNGTHFHIECCLKDLKSTLYSVQCINCGKYIHGSFLTHEQAEREHAKREEFKKHFGSVKQALSLHNCVKYSSYKPVIYSYDIKAQELNIYCKKYYKMYKHWTSLEDFQKACADCAQYIQPDKKPPQTVQSKKTFKGSPSDPNSADVSTKNTTNESIDIWEAIYKQIRLCSFLERKILIEVIEICATEGAGRSYEYDTPESHLKEDKYLSSEAVIFSINEKKKILNLEKVLTRLIQKRLLMLCTQNDVPFIGVSCILTEKLHQIKKLIHPQDIDNEIRYLVLKKDDFKCNHCGNKNSLLKIAYASEPKEIMNFSNMIALCEYCFDDLTINEVMHNNISYEDIRYRYISWQFITKFFPDERDLERNYDLHLRLIEKYGERNLIKALAVALHYQIKDNQETENSDANMDFDKLYQSAERTIVRAKDKNPSGEVFVYERVNMNYSVEKWLEALPDIEKQ